MSVPTFSPSELATLTKAGAILRDCLALLERSAVAGVTTLQLDAMAEEFIRSFPGALPAFKGYHGFKHTLCTSVNEQCVHGVPSTYALCDGDIVSLDCGVLIDGLYTDACITVAIGKLDKETDHLLRVTKGALDSVTKIIKAGIKTGDISAHIQDYVESRNCTIIRTLTGHGLGYDLHEEPNIPNYGKKGTGVVLPPNSVIAIEPIVCLGKEQVVTAADGWTLSMKDGKNSAHCEHTILVTEGGCTVLA